MTNDIMAFIKARDPHEREFHQAVSEVMESVKPVLDRNPRYRQEKILERITNPSGSSSFRVLQAGRRGPTFSQPGLIAFR